MSYVRVRPAMVPRPGWTGWHGNKASAMPFRASNRHRTGIEQALNHSADERPNSVGYSAPLGLQSFQYIHALGSRIERRLVLGRLSPRASIRSSDSATAFSPKPSPISIAQPVGAWRTALNRCGHPALSLRTLPRGARGLRAALGRPCVGPRGLIEHTTTQRPIAMLDKEDRLGARRSTKGVPCQSTMLCFLVPARAISKLMPSQ
ncbi:hypothetical protein P154DRAFT_569244 [Amniculicola lignicola CBS 123094]|uniref:Uncharacterized protein n=1 Tax=Amniculicola lignicola CBS 123094 TaxID=1392246 RepID=A0A6A5X371_9PLEO|nr:hypothetical protein P154DRAFT_569244 [Amniculicola lignicola CBS 123094]